MLSHMRGRPILQAFGNNSVWKHAPGVRSIRTLPYSDMITLRADGTYSDVLVILR